MKNNKLFIFCLLPIFIVFLSISIALADFELDSATKQMMRDSLQVIVKSMELQKKYPVPEPIYSTREDIQLKADALSGILHTRQMDVKISYSIQLSNLKYQTVANQKEIDQAQAVYEAAMKKEVEGTSVGDMAESMEREVKRQAGNKKNPEYRCVVIGNALLRLNISQVSQRTGILSPVPTVIINCPVKIEIADASMSLAGEKAVMERMTGIFKEDDVNMKTPPDVVMNFYFDFNRRIDYMFRASLEGKIHVYEHGSSKTVDTGQSILAEPDKGVMDMQQYFGLLMAYGVFTDNNKKLSVSIREKMPIVQMYEKLSGFKRIGKDYGAGKIDATPKWPRPRGKKAREESESTEIDEFDQAKKENEEPPQKEKEETKEDEKEKDDYEDNIEKNIYDILEDVWEKVTAWHFEDREARNRDLPDYDEIDDLPGWRKMKQRQAQYHQNGKGEPELKYVCEDGREVVYDGDEPHEIVTDPRYKGTYNYCNPAADPKPPYKIIVEWPNIAATYTNHFVFDMVPYYIGGNVRGEY